MDNEDRNWKDLAVLHCHQNTGENPELRIIGTLEGLGALLYAIAIAMGTGKSEAEVLRANADFYTVRVEMRNFASEWEEFQSSESDETK
jgi:hypothetical protein